MSRNEMKILPAAFLLFVAGLFLPHGLSSACFVVFLAAVLSTSRQKFSLSQLKEPIFIFQILLFGLTTVSMFWTSDKESGWNEVVSKLSFLLAPIAFSNHRSTQAFRWMMHILWATGLAITLFCVSSVFTIGQRRIQGFTMMRTGCSHMKIWPKRQVSNPFI